MVLKRYDGSLFKLNVAESSVNNYDSFIVQNTLKPVEEFSAGVSQLISSVQT